MEDKRYSMTLADGTVLRDLRLNGNTFISKEPVNPAVFEGNCSPVVIRDGETAETHAVMEYMVTAQPVAGEFWFSLRDVSEQEQAMAALNQAVADNAGSMTDLQMALTEVYEMMLGGM